MKFLMVISSVRYDVETNLYRGIITMDIPGWKLDQEFNSVQYSGGDMEIKLILKRLI